jgi:hypothetical protein
MLDFRSNWEYFIEVYFNSWFVEIQPKGFVNGFLMGIDPIQQLK